MKFANSFFSESERHVLLVAVHVFSSVTSAVGIVILDIPVNRVVEFEKEFFEYIKTTIPEVPASIRDTKVISDEADEKLKKAIVDFKEDFLKQD